MTPRALPLVLLVLLQACAVGPDYRRPPAPVPAAFKEGGAGWKAAEPRDDAPRGPWWTLYNDPVLNELMPQVSISNQNLAQAEARFRQASALVDASRAGFFPTVTAGLSTTRSRASATTIATPSNNPVSRGVVTSHSVRSDVSWEPDLWGRVRRTVESDIASAQASVADLESARLSAQASLAQSYFQLRSLDAERRLFDQVIAAYERSLQLSQNQYNAGVVARADVVQATVQLKSAQSQALDLGVQRATLEHAIAVLIGKPPSEFSIAPTTDAISPPPIPPVLPSQLLERRPDIAAAERRMAAANAQIGVNTAAYFPSLTINGAIGLQSATYAQWLTAPSRFWSIGPAFAQTLFDGGLRRAQTNEAIAAYDASVALYRQTVLGGLQEVEDSLATLRVLEEESKVQEEASAAALQSVQLSLNQYKAGTINFLQVVVSQAAALNNLRTSSDILARRMTASVQLIKALGGDWNASQLPADVTYPAGKAAANP